MRTVWQIKYLKIDLIPHCDYFNPSIITGKTITIVFPIFESGVKNCVIIRDPLF